MERYKVAFDALECESPMPGTRFKVFRQGAQQFRLVEITTEFVDPHWCEKGHQGFVIDGELEVDFKGSVVRYPKPQASIFPMARCTGTRPGP